MLIGSRKAEQKKLRLGDFLSKNLLGSGYRKQTTFFVSKEKNSIICLKFTSQEITHN